MVLTLCSFVRTKSPLKPAMLFLASGDVWHVVPVRTWCVPVPLRTSGAPAPSVTAGGSRSGVFWIPLRFGVSESKTSPSASIPITRVFFCPVLSCPVQEPERCHGQEETTPRRGTMPLSPSPWGPRMGD